jgi:dTDP-4-amino-4,6-dideoxygalactose transaminase
MNETVTRRRFLAAAPAAGAGIAVAPVAGAGGKPALLGGAPVRKAPFPSWPVTDATEEQALTRVLRSGQWYRGNGQEVNRFEEAYARLTGAKFCLATANGTSALLTSLAALGVGPGDEVILPPYTFVATVNVVLMLNALPVFVDSDRETFQIDARKIEGAISDRTAAIMPVHLGGSAADLDSILAVARKRKIPVVEDTCQAHLGEWRERKLGTLGDTGCFSFQASKNLNSGEGGAILTNNADIVEKCFAFHNNSRGRRNTGYDFSYSARGLNLRMTEFQAALLMAQMTRLERQSRTRTENATYLTSMLAEIPGITPARMYHGCTRNAYHLYMFRYDKEKFAGLPRAKFLKALGAEGIPASGGYSPLNKEPFLKNTLESPGYQAIYSKKRIMAWADRNHCPENDRLCGEAVWFTQNMLLGPRSDMDQIAEAVHRIQKHAADLARA